MELIKILGKRKNKTGINSSSWGLFLCSKCHSEVEKRLSNGRKTRFCGCGWVKHGETNTRLFLIWTGMRTRCSNANDIHWKNYGGRGITICVEWSEYIPFRDWARSNGYMEGLTIDRIDNDGNYEPSNCRWVTNGVNSQKKRSNRFNMNEIAEIRKIYKVGGFSQKDIAKAYNINSSHMSDIVNNKIWKIDEVDYARTI